MSIETSAMTAGYWADLAIHLVVNTGCPAFITSDNPAVLYNQYCEPLKGRGTTGAIKKGLQVFVPLSPRHLILLYDSEVYKFGDKKVSLSDVSNTSDLATLNSLQAVNADKVVLFSNWEDQPAITQTLRGSMKYRRPELSQAVEFVSDTSGERDALFQIYPVPLNIKLSLSFGRLRKNARRIPPRQRGLETRKPYKQASVRESNTIPRERQRFVRKDLE